jgi:hypothetical protein
VGQRGLLYNLFRHASVSTGGRLVGKFLTFTEKRTERSGKYAAGTLRRMQETFSEVQCFVSILL